MLLTLPVFADNTADSGGSSPHFKESEICDDLPLNEPKLVVNPIAKNSYSRPSVYKLTKTGPKSHRVELNIKFVPLASSGANPDQAQAMNTRAQDCLRKINPSLKTKGGDSLELQVHFDDSSTGIPVHTIRVDPSPRREETPTEMSANIECGNMVHELLHVVGLRENESRSF